MENARVAEKFGYATITLAAFCVGMLLGGRYCQPSDDVSLKDGAGANATTAQTQKKSSSNTSPSNQSECPDPPPAKIIYKCPPPEPIPQKKSGVGGKRKVKKKVKLPDPEPELDPLERKRLLAWVRDQSSDLKRCRDNSKDVYRVAVILHLDPKTKALKRVDVNADRSKVSGGLIACLRREILSWRPPKSLVAKRTKLVFGLNI